MDTAFLIVVAAGVCLLSGMIAARLGAAGQPPRRIALVVVELWFAVALWVTIFWSLAPVAVTPGGVAEAGDLRDLASRLASLPGTTRLLAAAGIMVSVVLVAHLMSIMRRVGTGGPGR
jgi:hypothetical protein